MFNTRNSFLSPPALAAIFLAGCLFQLSFCDEPPKPKRSIGVLTLFAKSISKLIAKNYSDEFTALAPTVKDVIDNASYITESYMEWLQSVGFRAVPLDIRSEDDQLLSELERLDGILLTGGSQQFYAKTSLNKPSKLERQSGQGTDFPELLFAGKVPDEYLIKVQKIVQKVKQINDQRRRFPLWATCLGFEATLITDSHFSLLRHEVDNELRAPLPVDVVNFDTRSIRFFDPEELRLFGQRDLFYFNHKFGFKLDEVLSNPYLKDQVVVVATITKEARQLVVWFEYKDYPFIGTQFHPEKFEGPGGPEESSEAQFRRKINHKMALLFKSQFEQAGGALKGIDDNEEFEAEKEDAHFDLYNIGMYHHINLYVRDQVQRDR